MKKHGEAFVGIDTAKTRNAVAVAETGRRGEIRYLGEYDTTPDAVAKLVRRLADRYEVLHFCYEAGPTGYGLYRQILALGDNCTVVAPSMIPRKPGERVKTNRRDAQSLARMHRAGELTAVWVPDARRYGTWCAPVLRRPRTTAANASRSARFSYGTAGALPGARHGKVSICAG